MIQIVCNYLCGRQHCAAPRHGNLSLEIRNTLLLSTLIPTRKYSLDCLHGEDDDWMVIFLAIYPQYGVGWNPADRSWVKYILYYFQLILENPQWLQIIQFWFPFQIMSVLCTNEQNEKILNIFPSCILTIRVCH